jgi:hypothetical protein
MNYGKIEIKPQVVELNELYLQSVSIHQHGAQVICSVVNTTAHLGKTITLDLTADEYNAWGDNDEYIETLVLSKLGLEKA